MKQTATFSYAHLAFFLVMTLGALGGGIFYAIFHGVTWVAWTLFTVMLVLTLMSISAGYHRLYSHCSYEAAPWLKIGYLVFGAAALQHSALKWATQHRIHHRYVDTDLDPYNIKRGAWWAHMGWIFYDDPSSLVYPVDLKQDRWILWQEKHWLTIGLLAGFLLPAVVGFALGDFWGGLIFGGLIRLVVSQHLTFMVNSLVHMDMVGSQPYSDSNSARDSWLAAVVTFGEGYHNFHHWSPSDYRNGVRAHAWDPSKWFICALSWVGQTSNLRRTGEEKIAKARASVQLRKINEVSSPLRHRLEEMHQSLLAEVHALSLRRKRYLEAQKRAETWTKANKELLERQLHEARIRLRRSYKEWQAVAREAEAQI